jgi:hypothetical protein
MANAIVAADRWLTSVLSGVGDGGVYGHDVPRDRDGTPIITPPYVFFTLAATADNFLTHNAHVVWSPLVYVVRYVDNVESYTLIEDEAAEIEAALSRASGSNVSGIIAECIYEAPFAMVELARDGSQLRHLGGRFRLHVQ